MTKKMKMVRGIQGDRTDGWLQAGHIGDRYVTPKHWPYVALVDEFISEAIIETGIREPNVWSLSSGEMTIQIRSSKDARVFSSFLASCDDSIGFVGREKLLYTFAWDANAVVHEDPILDEFPSD